MRVLVDGAWGFSSSANLDLTEAERITREALEIAAASGIAGGAPVELDETEAVTDTYRTAFEQDPFGVSLDDKLAHPDGGRCGHGPRPGRRDPRGLHRRRARAQDLRLDRRAWIEQEIVEAGGGIEATAVNDCEMQERS